MVGAFYRIHTTRSGLLPPNHTKNCSDADDAAEQIRCLVRHNPCSTGYTPLATIDSTPIVAAPVNNVAPTIANVQKLVLDGTPYPLARKLYLNSIIGFDNIPDVGADPGKDAEIELAKCFASLPFNGTINVASPAYDLIPLPAGTSGVPTGLCEDFDLHALCGSSSPNVNGCAANPTGIPTSSCTNGLRDGIEIGVDLCPAGLSCNTTSKQCQ
jgi:hypothetical protein